MNENLEMPTRNLTDEQKDCRQEIDTGIRRLDALASTVKNGAIPESYSEEAD